MVLYPELEIPELLLDVFKAVTDFLHKRLQPLLKLLMHQKLNLAIEFQHNGLLYLVLEHFVGLPLGWCLRRFWVLYVWSIVIGFTSLHLG